MIPASVSVDPALRDLAGKIWTARIKLFGDAKVARRITTGYAASRNHNQAMERAVLAIADEASPTQPKEQAHAEPDTAASITSSSEDVHAAGE